MADYDRDGFLDLYLCAYSLLHRRERGQGRPADALSRRRRTVRPTCSCATTGMATSSRSPTPSDWTRTTTASASRPPWGDYDEDGWPDLLVANDFGRKNLYRNLGLVNGQVRFKDVADEAGVEDYGAGMSAAFVDYDNDGHLDIYTGNMWTAAGQRVTALPGFMPRRAAGDPRALPAARARATRCSTTAATARSRTSR